MEGSICLSVKTVSSKQRAMALNSARKILTDPKSKPRYIDHRRLYFHYNSRLCSLLSQKAKVLIFKNIFNTPGKEENIWFSPGSLYLCSSLKNIAEIIISNSKICLEKKEFITDKEELATILKNNPDLNFVCISLCEGFFEKAQRLIKFLRKRTRAFIGVGGVMPTLNPEHVFVHLPAVDFLVRGSGELILPRIVEILGANNIDSALSKEQVEGLLRLEGFFFRNKQIFIFAHVNRINKIENYDRSELDFKFVNSNDLTEGLNLFTARGCRNNCFFCTTPGRGTYIGKSYNALKDILINYHLRLKEIFTGHIPDTSLRISFNDDDFLADHYRAKRFFAFLKKSPFRINFFQTGINSFFMHGKHGRADIINRSLVNSICPTVFSSQSTNIYIGTENFCDAELRRLNKGYTFSEIKQVVHALSKNGIYQAHHLILTNHLTEPEDIIENLFKIAALRTGYGAFFNVLTPVIAYLVSLYPSFSYKIAIRNKRAKFLNIRSTLALTGHPEYNYPLVENDIPMNRLVRDITPEISALFNSEEDYTKIFDTILVRLFILSKKKPAYSVQVRPILMKYRNYPEIIFKQFGFRIRNDRNNLQLMITRRCQLRCTYCPIDKKDADMKEETLHKAIDLLFSSDRKDLRLDFTGGEPLLRFDLVKKGVRYAKKLAKLKGKSVSFYLVTNLIALTDEIADFFARENFFLELSMDGKERFHNRYKISADGKANPYKLTTSQLKKIFSRKINSYAVMVVSPETAGHIFSNFCHLLEAGFRQIGINYSLGTHWDRRDREEFFDQMEIIKKRLGNYIKKGVIKLGNLDSRLEPAILNGEIMVDTTGKVYLLSDWLFEKRVKEKAPSLGGLDTFDNLNDIFLSRYRSLSRLFEFYNSDSIQDVIINNIEMGNLTKEYFRSWKIQ